MENTILDLMSAAIEKRPTDFQEQLAALLYDRASRVIEEKRISVAKQLYGGDDLEESVEPEDEDFDLDDLDLDDLELDLDEDFDEENSDLEEDELEDFDEENSDLEEDELEGELSEDDLEDDQD